MSSDVELKVFPLGQTNTLEARQAIAILKETYQRELPAGQKQPQSYTSDIGAEDFLEVS